MKRTHTCGELTEKQAGQRVSLDGWVHTRRDHGGVIFIDLRDRYGLTQIIFNPGNSIFKEAEKLRREDVIRVGGVVNERKKGMENPGLKTGKIELFADSLEILNKSDVPPIEVDDRIEANEEQRLKYRYLDLRRPIMQKHLRMRHDIAQAAREFLNKNNFLEVETPLLVRATPEGARDYIVPSRTNPGKFYALPQSPQLYKQILMVSGCDRYYQIARCLRDEDLRADRQPEHTQIDMEMSFVDENDIMEIVEEMYKSLFKKVINADVNYKFPRLKYDDVMEKYGSDKPDLRFGLELKEVTDIVKKSDFDIFQKAECVKSINPEKDLSRKEIEELTDFCIKEGLKGLAWIKFKEELEGSILKYLSKDVQKGLMERLKPKKGSTLFFIAGSRKTVNTALGKLRLELGKRLNLVKGGDFKFCWVVDFPLFEWVEEEEKWTPCHHMFTSPKPEDLAYLEKNPGRIRANLYDLVLNGTELGSGSIRINRKDLQERVMRVIGLDYAEAEKKFGFLLNAFRYGAPPHGGIGLGLDRTVALMCGLNDIREVIAFPKNKNAECPMDNSPNEIPDEQLRELHIKLGIEKKKAGEKRS